MKKQVIGSVLAMTMLLGIVATAGAQSLPGSGWYTSATFQNVGLDTSTINLDVYPLTGVAGTASSVSFSLNKNASKLFLPGAAGANGTVDVAPSLASNFSGSMVVSSTQPVVAQAQIGNNPIGIPGLGVTGGTASEQYAGSDAVSSVLSFPIVKSNFFGKTNIFYVQAGGSNVTYSATIKAGNGTTHTKTGSITANHSALLTPANFSPAVATTNCGSNPNTSPCFGSLSITASGGNIVGAEVEFVNNQSPASIAQSTSLFPDSEATNTVFCPVFKNSFGPTSRFTGMTVANTGTSPAQVSVTFTEVLPVKGRLYNDSATIPPGASAVFSAQINKAGGMPAGTFTSAKISAAAGAKLVAVVSESNFSGTVKATTYSCKGLPSATSKVAVPVFKEDFAGRTGLAVQNVDSSATTVTATFSCGAPGVVGNYTLTSPSIGPNEGYTFFDVSTKAGGPVNGSFCGVTLDGAGKKIIAIAQTSQDFQSPPGLLNTQNVEGFNLQ